MGGQRLQSAKWSLVLVSSGMLGQQSYADVYVQTSFFGIGGNFLSRGVGERDIRRTLLMIM